MEPRNVPFRWIMLICGSAMAYVAIGHWGLGDEPGVVGVLVGVATSIGCFLYWGIGSLIARLRIQPIQRLNRKQVNRCDNTDHAGNNSGHRSNESLNRHN